eukprot:IDg7021t1
MSLCSKRKESIVFISIYVNDFLLSSESLKELVSLKISFCRKFEIIDCRDARDFLGLEIRRDRSKKTLDLSQKIYSTKVFERFGTSECKPVITLMKFRITPIDFAGI